MKWAVELENVRVEMEGGRQAEFSLAVPPGEFLALVGPHRSGASLILKLCAGLVMPEQGTVRVLEQDLALLSEQALSDIRRRIGVVLQQPGLRSNMTLVHNVALPLIYYMGVDQEVLRPRIMPLLETFGLAALHDRFPAELTSGEARCAALARALVMDQEVLLLDELTEGMDAEMIQRVRQVLIDCRRSRTITVLATMHTASPLLEMADRIAFVRDGRVEAIGSRADMLQISDPSVKVYVTTHPVA